MIDWLWGLWNCQSFGNKRKLISFWYVIRRSNMSKEEYIPASIELEWYTMREINKIYFSIRSRIPEIIQEIGPPNHAVSGFQFMLSMPYPSPLVLLLLCFVTNYSIFFYFQIKSLMLQSEISVATLINCSMHNNEVGLGHCLKLSTHDSKVGFGTLPQSFNA